MDDFWPSLFAGVGFWGFIVLMIFVLYKIYKAISERITIEWPEWSGKIGDIFFYLIIIALTAFLLRFLFQVIVCTGQGIIGAEIDFCSGWNK